MIPFTHYKCPECEFTCILPDSFKDECSCPMCASDTGHDVTMKSRPATEDDKVEGYDARKDPQ